MTKAGRKMLIGISVICNRQELLFVNDETIQPEGLVFFQKILGKVFW